MKSVFYLVLVVLLLPLVVLADYEAGRRAANRGDFSTALKEWEPLATQGDREAQFSLGRMYARGDGVPRDFERAAELFRRSALHGHGRAAFNLGMMYEAGDGVPQDLAQAKRWFKRADSAGEPGAPAKLAKLKRVVDLPDETPTPHSSDAVTVAVDAGMPEPMETSLAEVVAPAVEPTIEAVVAPTVEQAIEVEPPAQTSEVVQLPDPSQVNSDQPVDEVVAPAAPAFAIDESTPGGFAEPEQLAPEMTAPEGTPPPPSGLDAISRFLRGS